MDTLQNKIYKPKTCNLCPCYKENTKEFWCGCMPIKEMFKKNDINCCKKMYDDCIIDWDIKNNYTKK